MPPEPQKPLVIEKTPALEKLAPLPALLNALSQGVVSVIEFRGQKSDEIRWSDKKTGVAKSAPKINVSAEFLDGTQCMMEYMGPRDASALEPLPYSKGDKMLVVLSGYKGSREGNTGRIVSHQPYVSPA
jgi:hypothetical protein